MKSVRTIVAAVGFALFVSASAAPAAPALSQLRGVTELKDWFNASKGHPRLVLLLSPT